MSVMRQCNPLYIIYIAVSHSIEILCCTMWHYKHHRNQINFKKGGANRLNEDHVRTYLLGIPCKLKSPLVYSPPLVYYQKYSADRTQTLTICKLWTTPRSSNSIATRVPLAPGVPGRGPFRWTHPVGSTWPGAAQRTSQSPP